MKRSVIFPVFFLAITLFTAHSQTSTPPASGDGSSGNPYQIATLDNLYWLSQSDTAWDKHFIQTADINAAATTGWDGGEGFSPIGNATNFTGSYNGAGYTIDSLYINSTSNTYTGFFGYLNQAEIDSLSLTHVNISGVNGVGGLAGYAIKSTTNHCSVTGRINGNKYTGGLIGYNYESSVTGCHSNREVTSTGDYTGGLFGQNMHYKTIRNSYSEGTVTGTGSYTGGFTGESWYHTIIENCYSRCDVQGADFTGWLCRTE